MNDNHRAITDTLIMGLVFTAVTMVLVFLGVVG